MPLFLLFAGILAVVVAIKGNYADVATQLEKDFTGSGNFVYWIAAIVTLGIIGNVAGVPRAAKLFIGLIVVTFIIAQQGLWTNISSALAGLQAPAAAPPPAQTTASGANAAALSAAGALPAPSSLGGGPLAAASALASPFGGISGNIGPLSFGF